MDLVSIRGRGAAHNPKNRFERLDFEEDGDARDEALREGEVPAPRTVYLRDASRSVLARNDSPDVGFDVGLNPYRGCEHGCVYCFARPTHEYLGFSAGLDFETRILVKEDAPELLRAELASPRWVPTTIGLSGVTDPYQPIERKLGITRRCLEVLAEARNPVAVITKNHLVTRDADLLGELAAHDAAVVNVSVTSLDVELQRAMEPRTSSPARRLEAIRVLADAGVPVNVLIGPVIPGLNDHEVPRILQAGADAGARGASYVALRLPHGVKKIFADWLERRFPERKEKVLHRVREIRGGRLYDSTFHVRGRGTGVYADGMAALFAAGCRKAGLERGRWSILSTTAFRRPNLHGQFGLFDG